MDKSKILVDRGVINNTLKSDLKNPVLIRNTAVLDHDIDDALIVKAWERTKRVYPLIDSCLELEYCDVKDLLDPVKRNLYAKSHFYLVKPDGGESVPIKTKVPVRPGTDVSGNRLMCVSYFGNTVTLNAYHAFVDGSGMSLIFNTLIYSYLALYTGHEDENPVVQLTEGREISEYYADNLKSIAFLQDYTPVPIYTFPHGCKGFLDNDMVNDENIYAGTMNVSADEFMKFCKENSVNPSALLCAVSAKAAYAVNPDERSDVVLGMTIALKKMFGLENCISNLSEILYSYVTYDDIVNRTIGETAKKIRRDAEYQRSRDYFISYARLFDSYMQVPMFKPRGVTYMGTLNIGDNNSHIVDFEMETDASNVVFMIQLHDRFILTFQYGKATGKYLDEFRKIFLELGINAEITRPIHYVPKDSQFAVL